MDITFNTYYTYAQLTERLAGLAEQHPGIMGLSVLGKSHEGREIPLVVLTNRVTGPTPRSPRSGSTPTSTHRSHRVDDRAPLHHEAGRRLWRRSQDHTHPR